MKRLLSVSFLAAYSLLGQQSSVRDQATAQQQRQILTDAATAGTPLPVTITVADNVNIEAVMLPKKITKRVFGADVANHYAVIEVNISNRSNDAALIVQSLFIDTSGWKLAGSMLNKAALRNPKTYQSHSSTQEIASVEYRIVRGQVLDRQPWTARNISIRTMQVLGSIGTAFAFPLSTDVIKGIGAWNGAVIPGAEVFWPDGIIGQLNRISDYGFRNNKIVAQQTADIVIAFFPIDRFLTPSLRKVFLESPALFFNPFLMALDPKTRPLLRPVLRNVYSSDEEVTRQFKNLLGVVANMDEAKIDSLEAAIKDDQAAIKADSAAIMNDQAEIEKDTAALKQDQEATPKNQAAIARDEAALAAANAAHLKHMSALNEHQLALKKHQEELDALLHPLKSNSLYNFLNAISLNNVHITVSGIMTVDELSIPATIESSCFEKGGADMWAIAGAKPCSLGGRFLSGGVPKIPDAAKLGISGITVDKDASTDELLKFTFKLANPVKPPVEFDIVVDKEGKNGKTMESMKYRVSSSFVLATPAITSVKQTGAIATVTGTGFYSTPDNSFTVFARPFQAKDAKGDLKVKTTPAETATSFVLDTTKFDPGVIRGCYFVVAQVGTLTSTPSSDELRVDTSPEITAAKKTADGKSVEVTGKQFVNTTACGGSNPEFEILDGKGDPIGRAIPLPAAASDPTKVTLAPPDAGTAAITSIRIKGATAVRIQ